MTVSPARKRIQVQGVVQGVGFRPFVYRIAQSLGVRGHVLNSSEGVVIEAEAAENTLRQFLAVLETDLPPLARIDSLTVSTMEPLGETSFAIRQSTAVAGQFALVPPDVATCEECRRISRAAATGVTDIRSPTAPTAGRVIPSSAMFPTTARRPPWKSSRCAPTAKPSMTIPPIAAFTPNPTHVRSAGQAWPY